MEFSQILFDFLNNFNYIIKNNILFFLLKIENYFPTKIFFVNKGLFIL